MLEVWLRVTDSGVIGEAVVATVLEYLVPIENTSVAGLLSSGRAGPGEATRPKAPRG